MVRTVSRGVPCDLAAEALVLGSMVLYLDARQFAASALVPQDFHSVAHSDVFSAILAAIAEGDPIQVVTLAARLSARGSVVDRMALMKIEAQGSYAYSGAMKLVADLAARRRLIAAAGDMEYRGYDLGENLDDTLAMWEKTPEVVRAPSLEPDRAEEIVELVHDDESGWAIPDVLRKRERVIVTGSEGAGKSHLGRWVAMSVAAGRTPFALEDIEPQRTLIVDLENEAGDMGDAARRLVKPIGYSSGCHARSRAQGIDLTQSRDVRWLNSLVDGERPALLVIGPLYKMYRGAEGRGKASEEAAEIVAEVLDDLRVAYDVALWIEAHAPHGDSGDRGGGRPRGSSLWLGWPNFGRYMERQRTDTKLVRLKPWRGDRHRGRLWPWGLKETLTRPWVPVFEDPAKERAA